MRQRPLFWLAIAFVGGTVCAGHVRLPCIQWLILAAASAGIAGLFLRLRTHVATDVVSVDLLRPNLKAIRHLPFILFASAFLGAARYGSQDCRPELSTLFSSKERILVRLSGTVCERPRLRVWEGNTIGKGRDKSTQLVLTNCFSPGPVRQRLPGKVLLSIDGHVSELEYGDTVQALGWLSVPGTARNPGEFDYREFLAHRGVFLQLGVGGQRSVDVQSKGNGSFVFSFLMKTNRICRKVLYDTTGGDAAALLDGIVLGNRDSLPSEIEEFFVATGTRHLLAISGLHVGLVTGAVFLLLNWSGVAQRYANPAAIAVAFFYAFFTGGNTPSIRAAVMVGVFLAAPLFQRRSDSLNLLGLSAILIVGYDAHQPFSTGFQLSFVAVLAILSLTPVLQGMFEGETIREKLLYRERNDSVRSLVVRFVGASVCVSLAAWIGTFPLTAYTFNRVAPLAIIVNVFAYPIVFLLLSFGMAGFVLSVVVYPVGQWLILVSAGCGKALLFLVEWASHTPYVSQLYLPSPWWVSVILFYAWVGFYLARTQVGFETRHLVAMAILCCAVHLVEKNVTHHQQSGSVSVTVLDVGHGGATFIELPDGSNMLFDIGSRSMSDISSRTVAPYLWHRGITRLDRVFISHLDSDHYSGWASLVKKIRVKELYVTPYFFQRDVGKRLIAEARSAGTQVVSIAEGAVVADGNKWKLRALSPPAETSDAITWSDNDLSLTLQLSLRDVSILLPADIQDVGIDYILKRHGSRLQSDILMVPHHGGFTFRANELLEAVKPTHAVFSSWATGPNQKMVTLYKQHGAAIHITGRDGPALFQTDGGKIVYSRLQRN